MVQYPPDLHALGVKGYSITVSLDHEASQRGAPLVSLLGDETKLVTRRLGLTRFRAAGTAEFNGVNRDIRTDRICPLGDVVAAGAGQVSGLRPKPAAAL